LTHADRLCCLQKDELYSFMNDVHVVVKRDGAAQSGTMPTFLGRGPDGASRFAGERGT